MGPLEGASGAPAAEVSVSFDGAIVELRHLVCAARAELRLGGVGGFPLDDRRLPEAGLVLLRGGVDGFQVSAPPELLDGASVTLDGRTLPLRKPGVFPLRLGARFGFTFDHVTFEVAGCTPPARFALAPPHDLRQLLLTGVTALVLSLCLLVYLVVPHGGEGGAGAGVAPEVVACAHLLFPSPAGGGASPFGTTGSPPPPGRTLDPKVTRGTPAASAAPHPVRAIAERAQPQASPTARRSREETRALAVEAVRKAGILDALRDDEGSHLGSIFGREDPLGEKADQIMGTLTGVETGEASADGAGLSQVGIGAGGADTIGLGGYGIIGAGAGGGGSGVADGPGALAVRRAATIPSVRMSAPTIGPEYDPSLVRRVVRAHLAEIRYCYERALLGHPRLDGRLRVEITIAPSGSVTASRVLESTLADPQVDACVAGTMARLIFPAPRGGSILVRYPFVFERAP